MADLSLAARAAWEEGDIQAAAPVPAAALRPAAADTRLLQDALLMACQTGDVERIEQLAGQPVADPDGWDGKYGETGFFRACQSGRLPAARLLAERYQVDPERRSKTGRTPLIEAAANGRVAVARYLLGHLAVDHRGTDWLGVGAAEVRTKAPSFCCAPTVFLSKPVPFGVVPLDRLEAAETAGHTGLSLYLREYAAVAETSESLLRSRQRLALACCSLRQRSRSSSSCGRRSGSGSGGCPAGGGGGGPQLCPDLLEAVAKAATAESISTGEGPSAGRPFRALAYRLYGHAILQPRYGGTVSDPENVRRPS
eukprot:SAG22_NODE_523_length_9482_cov_4.992548_3_plen_311_part_00